MSLSKLPKNKKNLIWALSVVIPLAVALLFGIKIEGFDLSFLPPFYSGVNALTALILLTALTAVKAKKFVLHERLMKVAIALSVVFLLSYVLYHITSESTHYGGDFRGVYFFLLISHIALSVIVIPFVLISFVFATEKMFDAHKKMVKYAFPIWLYVAITGVVVYFMISPYYA